MTEEPRWPTATAVTRAFDSNFPAGCAYHPDMLAQAVIDACRDAWRASLDDPSQSPVGEVRVHPVSGKATIRAVHAVGLDTSHYPWTLVDADGMTHGMTHCNVKGWPVIGQVPGTPAAEAKP